MSIGEQNRIDSEKLIVWIAMLSFCLLFWFKFIPWLFVLIFFKLFGL
jgi:hypothetical protein